MLLERQAPSDQVHCGIPLSLPMPVKRVATTIRRGTIRLTVPKSNDPSVELGISESSTWSDPSLIAIHHHNALEMNRAPDVLARSVIMSLTW